MCTDAIEARIMSSNVRTLSSRQFVFPPTSSQQTWKLDNVLVDPSVTDLARPKGTHGWPHYKRWFAYKELWEGEGYVLPRQQLIIRSTLFIELVVR